MLLSVSAAWILRKRMRAPVAAGVLAALGLGSAWYIANGALLLGANGTTAILVAVVIPSLFAAAVSVTSLLALAYYWDVPSWLTRTVRRRSSRGSR